MNRTAKYGLYGAGFGALFKLVANGFKQYAQIQENTQLKFNWKEFLLEGGKGAAIGGVAGLAAGAVQDKLTELEPKINTDAYLNDFVAVSMLNLDSKEHRTNFTKVTDSILFLNDHFKGKLSGAPVLGGSSVKGTALESCSDYDVFVHFLPNSFTLEKMYTGMFEAFNEHSEDADIVHVRKQTKSIGVFFRPDNCDEIKVDFVPIRKMGIERGNTAGNLFVNPKNWMYEPSYTKTDVVLQSSARLSDTQKGLIVSLKRWRTDYDVPMSSYMIQLLVLRAYAANKYNIPKKFTDKLLMVLNFIRDNITSIRLISIENKNNDVNAIPDVDKRKIERSARLLINEVEYNPNKIQEFFSVN